MAKWDISALSSALEHDTTVGLYSALCQIDATHYLLIYSGTSTDGFAQVLEVNSSTYAVTEVGSANEFETLNFLYPSIVKVDSTHFFAMWSGDGADGYAQILSVNTSTWAVTAEGTPVEFDTTNGQYTACYLLDATHALGVYAGAGSDGFARVFTINSSTWAVTAETALEFDTTLGQFNSVVQVDSNHFVNFWYGNGSVGKAQAFTVNLSTWAVTAEGSPITFDSNTTSGQFNRAVLLDDNHILNAWYGELDQKARVFEVNLSTWAVTAVGTEFIVDTDTFAGQNALHGSVVALDETHVLLPWRAGTSAGGDDGFVRVFEINNSTWNITAVGASHLEFDTADLFWPSVIKMDMGHVIMAWGGSGSDGYAQCFEIEVSPTIVQNTADATDFASDTTPTLQFTGTDLNADSIRYQIQIDTASTFDGYSGVGTVIDSQTSTGSNDFVRGGSSGSGETGQQSGQSFTASQDYTIAGIILRLWKVGSPSDNLYVELLTGSIDGTVIATSDEPSLAGLGTSSPGTEVTFTLDTPQLLTSGVKYYLRYRRTSPTYDATNYWNIAKATSNTYANGGAYTKSNNAWSAESGTLDQYFQTFSGVSLLDKLSGTDSGFANTTDGGDTDPFDSGDLASFTVQAGDALDTDTYYWRVRALDPSGSNTWSDWSATRSFDVNATTTTTQTLLGRARITASTLQTILGKSRITAVTTKTLTGLANISTTATNSQTIQGLARLTKTVSQTITGLSRITATTTRTLTGLSRITATTTKTMQGLSRITASTTQTLLGRARVTASATQTILGRARITVSATQTLLGRSRITLVTSQTLQGLSRITASTTQTILGRARITASATQTLLGRARIALISSQTIQGLSRVTASTTRTMLGKASILKSTTQTLLGRARIQVTTSQTLQGLSRIAILGAQTILGRARITASATQTLLGRGRVTATTLQTILGKSAILRTTTQTIQGLGRISLITTQTLLGRARVTAASTQTLLGRSRILTTVTQTMLGLARIQIISSQTVLGKAYIDSLELETTQTIQGKASVSGTTARTIVGRARILSTVSATPKFIVVNGRVAYRVTNLYYIFV